MLFSWQRPSVNRKPRASRQQARARARSRSYHPSVERLEDRLAPANWNPIGPAPILHSVNTPGLDPVSGRISGLATDPTDANTIYIAAAGGGVWKTTNGGTTWTPLTDFQNPFGVHTLFMGSIAVAAGSDINHRILYAGTGEANFALDSFYGRGVLVSKDSGATWTLTGTSGPNNDSLFNRTAIGKVVIDPTDATGNTAYAAVSGFPTNGVKDHEGIWKTSDGGVHWTNTTATTVSPSGSNPFTDLVMDPHNHSVLFAAVGEPFSTPGLGAANGVYETTNGGASWSLTSFPSGSGTGRISLAIQDVGMMFTPTIYASVSDPTNTSHFGQLLEMEKSTDGGMTWNAVENESSANYLNYMGTAGFGMGWYNQTLAIDPADVNANTVYAGGSTNGGDSGFVKTTDGGMTWHDITVGSDGHGPHTDDHAVAFDHNGLLVDGNDGGVWRLDNPTVGMIHWTDLNGNLQITQFTGIAIHPTNLNIAFGGSQDNGTEKYTGSTAWNQVRGGDGGFVRIDPTNPIRVYGEFTGVSLFRSDDGGSTFSSKSAGIATHSGHVSFYVPYVLDPSNSNPVVLGTDFVNQSLTNGDSWTAIGTPGSNGFNPNDDAITAIATLGNTIYAATAGDDVFVTTDNGASWTKRDPIGPGAIYGHPLPFGGRGYQDLEIDTGDTTGQTAYICTASFTEDIEGANFSDHHLFKTTNAGGTWSDISSAISNVPVWSIAIDHANGILYIGTDNGVLFSTNGFSFNPFGTGMPNVQVVSLQYNASLHLLAAGTHGRGMFEIDTGLAELSITKTGPATVTAGTNITYTLTMMNAGPNDAHHVMVTDMVPTGTTFVSATPGSNPDGFAYMQAGATVTGTPMGGVMANGHTDTFILVVQANSSDAPGSTITNRATISSTTDDPTAADNTASSTATVTTSAEVSIIKIGPATATAGTNITYTITMMNAGPSDAQGVMVTDMVPTGTAFVSVTPGSNPDGFAYTQSAGFVRATPMGGVVVAGNTDTFTLVVTVNSNDPNGSTITNTVTITSSTDPTAADNTATATTTVSSSADLAVTKTGPMTASPGTNITYTIGLTNNGPSDAQGVSLTDMVPAGTTFVSAAPVSGMNPDSFTYMQAGGTVTGTPMGGVVVAGNTDKFILVVTVNSGDANGSTIINTATVTSTTPDPTLADNSATVTTTVNTSADLAVTKTGPMTAAAGTNITYTITLTNNGPNNAQGVSLTDAVPSGTTFVSAAPVSGMNPDSFSYSQMGGTVTGMPMGGVVVAGNTDKFTLVVTINSGAANGSTIINTATVTSSTPDPTSADNRATVTTTVTVNSAELSITKTGPATATAGNNITYTITMMNAGPSNAQSVMVTDMVPTGTTFVSVAPGSNPDGFAYMLTGTTVNGRPVGGIMVNGHTDTLVLVVHVNGNDPSGSTITNTVTITSTTTDPTLADNSATATTTVATSADLAVTKVGPSVASAGSTIAYMITVTNNGPSDAQMVVLSDLLPSNVMFVSQSQMGPDMFTLSHAGNSVSDTIATLPSGHSDIITITVTINANVANDSQISNTAMVSSSTSDPNPNNNSSTSTLTINNSTGLGVQPNQGKPISYYAGLLGHDLIGSAPLTSGGQTLAQWLATSFPKLFGGGNGAPNLSTFTNSQVAMYFETLYHVTTLPRWGAEIMAVALDVYFTTFSLGGTLGQLYGFRVDAAGLGAYTWNIETSGQAFGVPNGTRLTVFQMLVAANNAAVGGNPWANNVILHNQLIQMFLGINSEW